MKRSPRHGRPTPFPDDPLQDKEALIRVLFNQAGTGMAITLHDGRFIKVNSALCTMLGYPEENLLNRRLENIMAPDQWRRLSELSRDMLAGKPGRTQLTLECRHQTGKAVRGLLNLSVVAPELERLPR